ncbi:MAG: hypothetical protein VYC82_08575, partial [Verrucomicrobiota bacterium]|nr:hypothetical protein [Verrucomicrobiota bacterium]
KTCAPLVGDPQHLFAGAGVSPGPLLTTPTTRLQNRRKSKLYLDEVQEIVAKVKAGNDQDGAVPKLQWTGQEETSF